MGFLSRLNKKFKKFKKSKVGRIITNIAIAVASFYTAGAVGAVYGAAAGMAAGAAVGAAAGGVSAAYMGENVGKGMLAGGVTGLAAGYGATSGMTSTAPTTSASVSSPANVTVSPADVSMPAMESSAAAPSVTGTEIATSQKAASLSAGIDTAAQNALTPTSTSLVPNLTPTPPSGSFIGGALSKAGTFIGDNPMMSYLLLNTAASAFSPSEREEQEKLEASRSRRINRNLDVGSLNIRKRNYGSSVDSARVSGGMLNRGAS